MNIQYSKRENVGMLLVVFLCLIFINWHRHGYFLIVFPAFYMLIKGSFRYIDFNFILLLLFGLLYGVIDVLNTSSIGYANFYQPIINFPLLYLAGKELGLKNSDEQLGKMLLFMSIALGCLVIYSVLVDVRENGFAVMYRSIQIIGDEDYEASATNAASRLIPLIVYLSLILVREKNRLFKLLSIFVAVIAVICAIRIQSRSSIFIVIIAFLVSLFCGTGSKQDVLYKVISIVLLILLIPFLFRMFSSDIYIIDRFQSDDLATGHERTELASGMIPQIMTHPFGGLKELKYAHNLWLDMARVSGWFPLLVFIIVTIRWIKYTISVYKNKTSYPVFRVLAVSMSLCLFVYFNVEPILEGAAILFSFFCVFLGMIATRVQKSNSNLERHYV